MVMVCVNRPNRTRKRTWTPPALTRIVKEICENYGQEVTEEACAAGYCDWSQCQKVANAIISMLLGYLSYLAVTGTLLSVLENPVVAWFLRKVPGFAAVMTLLRVENITADAVAVTSREVELMIEQLKDLLPQSQTGGGY